MTDKKKNKLVLVKADDPDDAALDAAIDAALDRLFGKDDDAPAEEGKKRAVRKPPGKKVKPKKGGKG